MTENKGKNKTKEADSRAASLNTCQGWTTLPPTWLSLNN